MKAIYDGFSNWQNVANEFTGIYDWSDQEKKVSALQEIPEPDQVIVAAYKLESYEGHAWVVYRVGGKYYSVEGSHCSCHGLEDQWNPEEYESADALLAVLKKGDWAYGAKAAHLPAVISALEAA